MSIYARLRTLLALSVLVIGGSVWMVAGQQRDAVIGMQGQLRASNDLLTAMLDQETGLRGYALTNDHEFLEPYTRGRREFERALREASAGPARDRVSQALVQDLTETARQWQANAATAVDQVDRRGPRAINIDDTRKRKAIMNHFRTADATLVARVEQRAQARLQGADDEREAKELLRRRAERLAAGADAVVLTRNASGNALLASTNPSAIPGLAEALVDAAPRSCLAIRHARTHEGRPGTAPLQTCELCDRGGGGSLCVPSVVGGEVIGSVLVLKDDAIKPAERESVAGAVAQAAPVLANLRNLAIAEHRAATDPLTRLPNARSVQEALIRMVAQSSRTGSPLSTLVLDLDHFKALNDRLGHQAGTDHAGALLAAEAMRAGLEGLPVPGVTAHVTASLGVATLPDHADDGASLIRAADRALYRAKTAGRNRVEAAVPAEMPVT